MLKRNLSTLAVLLAVVFLVASIAGAAGYKYVGTKKSNKYHLPSCKWAMKIKPDNLRTFKSAKEAQAAGYVPCKVCKPPATD